MPLQGHAQIPTPKFSSQSTLHQIPHSPGARSHPQTPLLGQNLQPDRQVSLRHPATVRMRILGVPAQSYHKRSMETMRELSLRGKIRARLSKRFPRLLTKALRGPEPTPAAPLSSNPPPEPPPSITSVDCSCSAGSFTMSRKCRTTAYPPRALPHCN